ncbi:MAG: cyclase [Thermomicrobiales bacterium]|nr:MAG: cyclase [Thermomicrobiales bacterium]
MCSPEVIGKVHEEVSRRRLLSSMAGAAAAFGALGIVTRDARGVRAQEGTPEATPVGTPSLPSGFTQVVDLTHVASPDFPMFPGAQQMKIDVLVTVQQNGFYKNQLTLDEHTGTHMDAPAHFVADGITAEFLPPERLIAPLCVVHIHERAASDPDAQVTIDDLLAWESQFGPLPAGAFVAMHSGWEARVGDPAQYINLDASNVQHYPGWHPDAAAFLVNERDIVGIGVDTLSLDFGASTDFKTHLTVLPAGKYGVENLANLAAVPPAGATIFIGGPKHRGASGGPVRALALV